jgi:hypothetical protein
MNSSLTLDEEQRLVVTICLHKVAVPVYSCEKFVLLESKNM